jgi:hypothetical protein
MPLLKIVAVGAAGEHHPQNLYRKVIFSNLVCCARDTLGSHRGQAGRRLIRAAGATRFFLPRNSPDLDPIEQVCAKLKTLHRKTDPSTIDAPGGIGDLLGHFTC